MRLRSGDAGGIAPGSGFDWSSGMGAGPERRRVALGALGLLLVLGVALRWLGAGQDLYADEVATYWDVSTTDFPGLLRLVSSTAEITPPLAFVLSWLTTQPDLSVETLRLPSLVAGVASIPLVYAVGVRTVGRGAGLLAAALVTVSPFMIFYSVEARAYAVMMAMVLLSTLSMLKATESGRKRWWAAYAAFTCLAAYAHYTAAFVLAAQFGWVLVTQARARWPASIATAAALVLYVPWLPSLKGDLDSPTTTIADVLLRRFTVGSVLDDVAHWLVGFPYATAASLGTLPGRPALLLLGCSAIVGATGIYSYRGRLAEWFGGHDNRVVLVAILAVTTPVFAILQSILGTNVVSVRNLAASWPYAALTFAALVTVGGMGRRLLASALATAALGIGAAMVISDDYRRPSFSEAAQFANENGGALVDGASFTPGPLANFDLEGSRPDVPVIRLSLPAERTAPFDLFDQPTPPAEVAAEAVKLADGGPINLVTTVDANTVSGGQSKFDAGPAFVAALPDYYTEAESRVFPGMVDLKVTVFEAESEGAGRP